MNKRHEGGLTPIERTELDELYAFDDWWRKVYLENLTKNAKCKLLSLPFIKRFGLGVHYIIGTFDKEYLHDLYELVYLSNVIHDEILKKQITFLKKFKIDSRLSLFSILFSIACRKYDGGNKDSCIVHACGNGCRINGKCTKSHDCRFCKYISTDAYGDTHSKNCKDTTDMFDDYPYDEDDYKHGQSAIWDVCERVRTLDGILHRVFDCIPDDICNPPSSSSSRHQSVEDDSIFYLRSICKVVSSTQEYRNYIIQIKKNPIPRTSLATNL